LILKQIETPDNNIIRCLYRRVSSTSERVYQLIYKLILISYISGFMSRSNLKKTKKN